MACRADVAIATRLDQHNHRRYLPRESSKHRWSECEYQMAHGFNGVFAVTVTSTLYANSGGQGCLAFGRLAVDHDGPQADASKPLAMGRMHGEMHGELHASRKCCRPEPRLTVTNWCRLEQKDREHQCWSIVCTIHYNIIYNITCQSFSSALYTDKGRVGAASHEDDNKTPRYLEQTAGGYWTAYYCPDLSAKQQGDVWRGRPGDVRRAFGG